MQALNRHVQISERTCISEHLTFFSILECSSFAPQPQGKCLLLFNIELNEEALQPMPKAGRPNWAIINL
jgi:hypothetical protein